LDFNEAGDDWVAVALAGPFTNYLLQTDPTEFGLVSFIQCQTNSVKALKLVMALLHTRPSSVSVSILRYPGQEF